jgi:hypothetical protein
MNLPCKISTDLLAAEPWGAGYLRELDLVVAANEFESLRTGKTVDNAAVEARAADRCLPLDGGLVANFIGVAVPDGGGFAATRAEIGGALYGAARGTWGVFGCDGGFDSFIADGYGGVGTESGHKFLRRNPEWREFNLQRVYASLLSGLVYERRSRLRTEIGDASNASPPIDAGSARRLKNLNGKTWEKIEFLDWSRNPNPNGESIYRVRAARRGAKTTEFAVSTTTMIDLFDVAPTLPEKYRDAENHLRLATLAERRAAAAEESWRIFREKNPDMALQVKLYGYVENDVFEGDAYLEGDQSGLPSGRFVAPFAAGGDAVVSCDLQWPEEPSSVMRR